MLQEVTRVIREFIDYYFSQEVRAFSGTHIVNNVDMNAPVRRSFTEGNMVDDVSLPFDNPEQALKDALRQIGASSEDW